MKLKPGKPTQRFDAPPTLPGDEMAHMEIPSEPHTIEVSVSIDGDEHLPWAAAQLATILNVSGLNGALA